MNKVELLLPIGESVSSAAALAPRLVDLHGATIGIVANSWQCMTTLADQFAIDITEQYGGEVVKYTTPTTAAMPAEVLQDIKNNCDAVIVGIGS